MSVESSTSGWDKHNEGNGSNWPMVMAKKGNGGATQFEVSRTENLNGKYIRLSIELYGHYQGNTNMSNLRVQFNPMPNSIGWSAGGATAWPTVNQSGNIDLANGCSAYNNPSTARWNSAATAAGHGDLRYNGNYTFDDGITRSTNGTPNNELIMDQGTGSQNRVLLHWLTIPLSSDITSEIAAGRISMTFSSYVGNRKLSDANMCVFLLWGTGTQGIGSFTTYKVATSGVTNGQSAYWNYLEASLSGPQAGVTSVRVGLVQRRGGSNVEGELYGKNMTLKITPSITVTANAASKVYGNNDPSFTYSVTTGKLLGSDALSGTLTRDAGNNVGSYTIRQGTVGHSNYNVSFATGILTITKRPVTVTANAATKIYGNSDPTFGYSITSGNLVYSDEFSGALTRTGNENVGTQPIQQGTLALSSNYTLSFVGNNLTITTRPVTITADPKSKIYGDADPSFTYSITSGNTVFSDTFSGSLARTAGNDVNSYPINQNTVTLGTNYNLSFVSSPLTITKRPVTARANALSKYYGDPDPVFTYTISSGNLVYSDTFSGTLSRVAGETVASYAMQQNTLALSSNYNLSFESAQFTINKRIVSVMADVVSKVYGDPDPTLTYFIGSGNLVFGDVFSGKLTRQEGETINDYAIYQGTLSLSANYQLIFNGSIFTITKRPVAIKANAASVVYGQPASPLGFSIISGSLAFDDEVSGALTRESGNNVGSYRIQRGTLSLNYNYDLTFTEAMYTITPCEVTITAAAKSKTYGQANPALTYTVTAGSLVTGETLAGSLTREAGEGVGQYQILQGSITNANNTNYSITYIGAALTVNPLAILANPTPYSKIYGEQDPALTQTISTGAFGESVVLVYTRETGSNVGSYSLISVGFSQAQPNYTVSFAVNGGKDKFVISKRPVTVSAVAINKVYGEDLIYVYEYTISEGSLAEGDTLVGTLACNIAPAANVYPILQNTITNANNPNYSITYIGANYIINKAIIEVVAPSGIFYKTYADTDPQLIYEVNGLETDKFFVSFTRELGEDVGTYDIIEVITLSTDYAVTLAVGSGKDKFAIYKRAISVSAVAAGHIYGNEDAALTYTTQNLPTGYTLSGSLQREAGKDYKASGYAILQGSITDANNTNYTITYNGATYTISKRPITVTALPTGHIYGDADAVLTFDSGDIVAGDTLQGALVREAGKDYKASGYAILQGSVTNANNTNYIITYVSNVYMIAKRQLSISPQIFSTTYGDSNPAFQQVVDGISSEQLQVVFTIQAGIKNAGSYPFITVSTDDTNYKVVFAAGAQADKFIIMRRAITLSAISSGHIFGEADTHLEYTTQNMLDGDTLSGSLMREAGETYKEGGYAILQGSITDEVNPNYTITVFNSAVYTISKRAVTVNALDCGHTYGDSDTNLPYSSENLVDGYPLIGSLIREGGVHWQSGGYAILQGGMTDEANPNYIITFYNATYTIYKRPITVTAQNKTIIYGNSDVALTYTVDNLVAGDTLVGELVREDGYTYKAGGYVISQGTLIDDANTDYLITFVNGVYTIQKRNIAVTPIMFYKVYGEDDPILTQQVNGINGEVFNVVFSRSTPYINEAGLYAVNGVVSVDDSNYTASVEAAAGANKYRIQPKEITINAVATGHTYGAASDAPLTYTHSPLAYNETNLNGALVREVGQNYRASGYRIMQGTLTNANNPNYSITYIEAIYTISKLPITITALDKTQIYGGAETPLEYEITLGALLDNDILSGAITRDPGSAVKEGGYAITQGSLNNPNYEITFIKGVYMIAPSDITIMADAKSIVYGEDDLILTYRLSPALYGDDMLSGSLAREEGSDANEEGYNILLGTLNNPNYNITFIGAKYIIFVRAITIAANDCTQIYGDPEAVLTYRITVGSQAKDGDLKGELYREAGINCSSEGYRITQGTLNNDTNPNYNITFVGARYYINRRPITVTADNKSQVYGDAAVPLTYKVTVGSLAYTDTLEGVLEREVGSQVRSYTILSGTLTSAALNTNYTIRFYSGTYSITPRPITVQADSKTIIYGEQDLPLTYRIVEGELIGSDVLLNSLARETGNNVGVYLIKGNLLYNLNYSINYIPANYTIQRRPITITAATASMVYGNEPILPYTAVNMVAGDSLVGTLAIPHKASVGVYPIDIGTLNNDSNPNYDINFISAYCTVAARPITITLKAQASEYGAPVIIDNIAYTITAGSIAYNDDLGITIERLSQSTFIGSYPLRASVTNSNYLVQIIAAYYSINKIKPVITAPQRQIDLIYTGKAYSIEAYINSHSPIIYYKDGVKVSNSFTEVGTYNLTLTANETDIYAQPTPITIRLSIKPTSISSDSNEVSVYRQQGFNSSAYLTLEESVSSIDATKYLTRTETLADTYTVSLNGDTSADTFTLYLKTPSNVAASGMVKVLVTEGEATRVLNLAASPEGYVSFEVSGDATVSFVAPVNTTSYFTIILAAVGGVILMGIVMSMVFAKKR